MNHEKKEKRAKRLLIAGIVLTALLFVAGVTTAIISNILRDGANDYNDKNHDIVEQL